MKKNTETISKTETAHDSSSHLIALGAIKSYKKTLELEQSFDQNFHKFIELSDEDKVQYGEKYSPLTIKQKIDLNLGKRIYDPKIPEDIISIETPVPVEEENVLKSGEVLEILMEKDSNVVLIALDHVRVPEDTASLVQKIRIDAELRVDLAAYLLLKFDNDKDLQKNLRRRNRSSIFNVIVNPDAPSRRGIPSRDQVALMALSKLDGTYDQEASGSGDEVAFIRNGKPSQDSIRYAADKIIGISS